MTLIRYGENICRTCKYCETDKRGFTTCRINGGVSCFRFTPCWLFKNKESEVEE